MRFLGLDLSLNKTGFAELDSSGRILNMLELRPGKLKGVERLLHMREALISVLPFGPFVAVIEGYSMGSKGKTYHIGEFGGVARVALFERGNCAVLTLPPTSLKGFATSNGGADKPRMIAAAKAHFGIDKCTDNEADALHLARTAHAWFYNTALPKRQAEDMLSLTVDMQLGVSPLRVRRRG